jgi:hypothetical protein
MEPKTLSQVIGEIAGEINRQVHRLHQIKTEGHGTREQSIAITELETGIMWLDRASEIAAGNEPK